MLPRVVEAYNGALFGQTLSMGNWNGTGFVIEPLGRVSWACRGGGGLARFPPFSLPLSPSLPLAPISDSVWPQPPRTALDPCDGGPPAPRGYSEQAGCGTAPCAVVYDGAARHRPSSLFLFFFPFFIPHFSLSLRNDRIFFSCIFLTF